MSLQPMGTVFDCDDVLRVATFWSAALDRPLDNDASREFASIGTNDPATPHWMFLRVPEKKTAKNRCHIDFGASDRPEVEAEVERLVALGATVLRKPEEEFGVYWATLQDPEGNEFCIGAH